MAWGAAEPGAAKREHLPRGPGGEKPPAGVRGRSPEVWLLLFLCSNEVSLLVRSWVELKHQLQRFSPAPASPVDAGVRQRSSAETWTVTTSTRSQEDPTFFCAQCIGHFGRRAARIVTNITNSCDRVHFLPCPSQISISSAWHP